jgi:NADH:ubiquinone oxidoreductase subunit F (NADH-binding)
VSAAPRTEAGVRRPITAGPAGTARLFVAGPKAGHAEHLAAYGPLPGVDGSFLHALEASGLTGRGGAAFAAWRKFLSLDGTSRRAAGPVLIANGAEGEPRSFKDRTLLANAPHLVIDGLLVAATVLQASRIYLYAGAENLPEVKAALAQRRDAGAITLAEAPPTFVAGQASAVVNKIETGRALPLDRARRLSRNGVKGRPTLVQNVETWAHIALIARYGAAWFRSVGTEADPGTRLVSVSGDVPTDLVLEVPGGAMLPDVLAAAGVGPAAVTGDAGRAGSAAASPPGGVGAVLVGGFHGRWVRPDWLRLSPVGAPDESVRPGAGVLYVLGAGRCGLLATASIVEYLAGESAGQCGPCLFGLPALSATVSRLAAGGGGPELVAEVNRLSNLVAGRGACHHPDGTVQLIHSALDTFTDDVQHHLRGQCAHGRN